MDDLVGMDEEQSFAHLLHDLLDLSQGELDVNIGEQAGQVVLAKVKHEIKCSLVSAEIDKFIVIEASTQLR